MQDNFVPIPKDIESIKQKFILGLTKRQTICFGIGLVLGLAAFFGIKALIGGTTIAMMVLCIIAAPFIIAGIWEKNGIHFEEYVKNVITFLRKPKIRTFQAENAYLEIERQIEYNRLRKMLIDSGFAELIPAPERNEQSKILGKIRK